MPIKSEQVDRNEILTFDGQPSNGERVYVGGKTYTFKKVPIVVNDLVDDEDGAVAIGNDVAETIANLHAAVTGEDGAGFRYARSTRAHAKLGTRKVVATHTTLIFGPEADKAEAVQKKKEATAEKEAKAFAREAKAEAKAEARVAAEVEAEASPEPIREPEPKPDPNRS